MATIGTQDLRLWVSIGTGEPMLLGTTELSAEAFADANGKVTVRTEKVTEALAQALEEAAKALRKAEFYDEEVGVPQTQ